MRSEFKTFLAQRTNVRPEAGVSFHVLFELPFVFEGFLANRTRKRYVSVLQSPLFFVNPQMRVQFSLIRETCLANRAGVMGGFSMLRQMRLPAKTLLAIRTRVRPRSQISLVRFPTKHQMLCETVFILKTLLTSWTFVNPLLRVDQHVSL